MHVLQWGKPGFQSVTKSKTWNTAPRHMWIVCEGMLKLRICSLYNIYFPPINKPKWKPFKHVPVDNLGKSSSGGVCMWIGFAHSSPLYIYLYPCGTFNQHTVYKPIFCLQIFSQFHAPSTISQVIKFAVLDTHENYSISHLLGTVTT